MLTVILVYVIQDAFTVWDPKQLIKKGRDRQLFLFDSSVVFSKKVGFELLSGNVSLLQDDVLRELFR